MENEELEILAQRKQLLNDLKQVMADNYDQETVRKRLDLRDQFATAVLNSLLVVKDGSHSMFAAVLAKEAYIFADAMMAERVK